MPELLVLKGSRIAWRGREFTDQVRRALAQGLHDAAQEVLERARLLVSREGRSHPGEPAGLSSGQLRDSLYALVDVDRLQASVGSTAPHAAFLEYGTMTDKVLHAPPGHPFSWVDPQTGQRVFAMTVHLRPIPARPFLRPALHDAMPAVERAVLGRLTG